MDIYDIKQFIRQKIWVTIFCALILAFCFSWASYLFVKTHAAVSVQTRSAYARIGMDETFHNERPNTYYLLHNINLKKTADASPIKSDVFMQGDGTKYYGNYLDGFSDNGENLSGNECAVSADFAKIHKLKAGGTLVVHPHGGEDYTVTVKTILPEYFGLKRADVYRQKGAVVLGYRASVAQAEEENEYKGYAVYRFTDDSQNASFAGTEITYKRDVLSDLTVNYYIAAGISVFALLFAVVCMDGVFGGDERSDACIFYGETLNRRCQLLYIAVYSLYKHGLAFLGAVVGGGVLTAIYSAALRVVFGYKIVLFLIVFGLLTMVICTAFSILINGLYAKFKR